MYTHIYIYISRLLALNVNLEACLHRGDHYRASFTLAIHDPFTFCLHVPLCSDPVQKESSSKRVLGYGVRAPVSYGNLRETFGRKLLFPKAYRKLVLFLQKSLETSVS